MRFITAILATSAVLAAGAVAHAAAPTTQKSLPPNYESVIQFDRPSLHLRFGDAMPGAPSAGAGAPNFGTAAVVSGAKATSEGVSLVDEYTIEWWQLVQDVESPHTVARIGGQDFGLLPVP